MIHIQKEAYICWAVMLLAVPLPWVVALVTASVLHELGHILAVLLLGGQLRRICVGPGGAMIHAAPMVPGKALLCSLAGPAAGALLIMFFSAAPRFALCALVLSCYNILPVLPLDGGHALEYFLIMTFDRRIPWIDGVITTIIGLTVIFFAFLWRIPGLLLVLLPLFREKYLANRGKKGYNSAAKQETIF